MANLRPHDHTSPKRTNILKSIIEQELPIIDVNITTGSFHFFFVAKRTP